MRSLAFLAIMLSALGFGHELLKPIKCRVALLRQLGMSMELMSAELSARPSPMDELCLKLSQRCEGEAVAFFQQVQSSICSLGSESFSDIWNEAADKRLDKLSAEQMRSIKALGNILGGYELDCQLNAINACLCELRSEYDKLKSEYPTNRKLCLALPCSIAAMLVVILI